MARARARLIEIEVDESEGRVWIERLTSFRGLEVHMDVGECRFLVRGVFANSKINLLHSLSMHAVCFFVGGNAIENSSNHCVRIVLVVNQDY